MLRVQLQIFCYIAITPLPHERGKHGMIQNYMIYKIYKKTPQFTICELRCFLGFNLSEIKLFLLA